MPRNDLKQRTKASGCERCGPRPTKPGLLHALAGVWPSEAERTDALKREQRRWDVLHYVDGQAKKLHEVLGHPDVLRAHVDELGQGTREVLDQAKTKREVGIDRLMKGDEISRDEAIMIIEAKEQSNTMETAIITGASADFLWKAYGREGIARTMEYGFPELAAEIAAIAPRRKIEPEPEDELDDLVREDEEPENVVPFQPGTFTPRKRPRPNPNRPRILVPSLDDLAQEWR
jgi:hypothetical protein